MKKNTIDTLVQCWVSDSAFRDELRADACAAAARRGIQLDERVLATLKSLAFDGPSGASLEARVSMLEPTNQC
jgi:hypothetical protein